MARFLRHGLRNYHQYLWSNSNSSFENIRLVSPVIRLVWPWPRVRCVTASYCIKNYASSVPESSELERMIDKDVKLGRLSSVFQRLKSANDDSLIELKKRTWGSVFYSLNQSEEFEKLDNIRKRTKDLNIKCGEGAYTTLIHSYITRGQVNDAVSILNDMKDEGLLRHSRTYFAVITSLAYKGYQRKAFELFNEMQHHIFKSNKNISLVIPSKMSIALIRSCIDGEKKEMDYEKAKGVFKLYNQSGWPLSPDILEATKDWFRSDPVDKWIVKKCIISEKGLCNSCDHFLNYGQLKPTERHDLQKDILHTIQSTFEEKGKRMHLQKFEHFLQNSGPFDIIIDGMNIGLSSNVKKQMKKFNFDAVSEVANHFVKQDKKVLVLVNSSIKKSALSKDIPFFVTDVGYDDLFIIYACATCSLVPYIVSRDKLREHRFFLDFENRSGYLRWTRSHTVRVRIKNNMLAFNMQNYDPVVQEGKNSWHFPVVGGRWFCAKKIE